MKDTEGRTYLKSLALALTAPNVQIFPNQTIMYQALVAFSANQDNIFSFLLPDIKNYVKNSWEGKDTKKYDTLHRELTKFLTNNQKYGNPKIKKIDHKLCLKDSGSLKSSVSAIMTGKRKAMKEWKKECKKYSDNSNIFVYRIFWILQYFFAKYCDPDMVRRNEFADTKSDYVEYYQLNPSVAKNVVKRLKQYCKGGSSFLDKIGRDIGGTRVLSRILFEIIYKHYECADFKAYKEAEELLDICKLYLNRELMLGINAEKTKIEDACNLDFLGFMFIKERYQYSIAVSDNKQKKQCAKIKENYKNGTSTEIEMWKKIGAINRGWTNYYQIVPEYNIMPILQKLDKSEFEQLLKLTPEIRDEIFTHSSFTLNEVWYREREYRKG